MTDEVILTGNEDMKSQGAWVQRDQGVADGFRNVSQYWLPKTLTFEQGKEKMAEQKMNRVDMTAKLSSIKFSNIDGPVKIDIDGALFNPTDWAGRQLCKWFNVPSTLWSFYHEGDVGDTDIIIRALRNGQSKIDKTKEVILRTYNDSTLRACMSDSYSIVDNEWYISILEEFLPGGRLSHFNFSDADNFYGNILIPDNIRSEDDSDYGGMLNCGNSEIGRSMVWQTPSIFRAICMNGCVWGEKRGIELRRRHRGIDLVKFREDIRLNIERQIPLLTTKISDLIGTHKYKATAPMINIFACIAQAHSLKSPVVNEIAEKWLKNGQEKTAFGVIDAITRAGQVFDADTWMKCDEIGGSILNGIGKWQVLNTRSNTLTEKEVNKAFGVSV